MRYPNSSKTYHKVVSHANRGMTLENLINDANKFYNENNIAVICKKPTPIGIVSVSGDENSKIITKAYLTIMGFIKESTSNLMQSKHAVKLHFQ